MIQEKKLTERTFSGFLWMMTGSGIQIMLKVGVLAVLARLVSPKEFGLISIAVIAVEFSKMLIQMGVGPAIVQRKELEDRHLTAGFTLSLFMGLFFIALLALIAPSLAVFFRMEGLTSVLRVVSLVFLLDSLTLIGQALMQRNMKFKLISVVEVASYAIGYGAVGIFLGSIGWGVWALVIAHISQAALHAILVVLVQPFPKKPGFEQKAFKELLGFGGGFTIARIGNYLALQGDNLVVGRMLGAAALGIYGRAYQLMVMPSNLLGTTLDKALFPAMAKVQDDKQKLGKAYLAGVSSIALVAIPLSIILVLLAPEIVLVLLGPDWIEVVLPFQILTCSLLFRMSYKMSDTLAKAVGAVYRRAWRQILYAFVVIAGSYIGQFWGLYGVACGVATALVVNFFMMTQLSLQLTSISWLEIFNAHRPGMTLGMSAGTLCYVLVNFCRLYFQSHFFTLLITGLVVGIILLLTICYLPDLFIKDDQKKLFHRLVVSRFKKVQTRKAWS